MTRSHVLLALAAFALVNVGGARAKGQQTPPPTFHTAAPLSADDKKHLLNDTFTVVKTVREMPISVKKLLIPDTKTIASGMADAGQEFRATDVVIKELPRRRLVLAAVNARYCLVYLEQGGRGYSQHVILFRLQSGRATRVWGSYLFAHPPLTFLELRAALKSEKR